MNKNEQNGAERIQRLISAKEVSWQEVEIFIRAFKKEEIIEVWGKNKSALTFQLLCSYPFCASSGSLGPKRKEGDRQIPEGFYYIDRFNPQSQFHLSLGINYPNEADLVHADPQTPGSDIFIHGGCETIGCIPITNAKIEELYALAHQAKQLGQTHIPVQIFPAKFSNEFYTAHQSSPFLSFWRSLYPMYKSFEQSRQLPFIGVNEAGDYELTQE